MVFSLTTVQKPLASVKRIVEKRYDAAFGGINMDLYMA
jgi:hypothetical protein